jgi:hypothetical protein
MPWNRFGASRERRRPRAAVLPVQDVGQVR